MESQNSSYMVAAGEEEEVREGPVMWAELFTQQVKEFQRKFPESKAQCSGCTSILPVGRAGNLEEVWMSISQLNQCFP